MIAGASTYSATNSFAITPVAITSSTSVAFADNAGATKTSVWNATSYDAFTATTTADKIADYEVKATITYTGDLDDKDLVQALWEKTVSNVVLDTNYTAVGQTSAGRAPVAGTAAIINVKFTSETSNYTRSSKYASF